MSLSNCKLISLDTLENIKIQIQIYNLCSKSSSSNGGINTQSYNKFYAFKKKKEDNKRIQAILQKDFGYNNFPFDYMVSVKLITGPISQQSPIFTEQSSKLLNLHFAHGQYSPFQSLFVSKIPELMEKYSEEKLLEYRSFLVGNTLRDFLFNTQQFARLKNSILNCSFPTGGLLIRGVFEVCENQCSWWYDGPSLHVEVLRRLSGWLWNRFEWMEINLETTLSLSYITCG